MLLAISPLFASSASVAQSTQRSNRITQELASGAMETVPGTVPPLMRRATDLGAVNADMQLESMTLDIGLSAQQQVDINTLMTAQQDPKSPQYHQWLTQEEYGTRFGLTESDMSTVTGWLTSQGFTVKNVAPSRNAITFSGKAWQVESTFNTQLHKYQLGTETHFANATELSLPAGLATVVSNVRGLSNFRPKPQSITKSSNPDFTSSTTGTHILSPGDWATIYNVTPIYTAGYTGSGMHIGIAGQTYIPQSDIDAFRTAAGLGATQLNMVCISTTNCTGTAGENFNDIPEADVDVEWAGGIAKNATVDFIYASGADPNLGAIDALIYAITTYQVNGKVVPVLSMSYANCEPDIGTAAANAYEPYFEQASTQGQTIMNSAGDQGAAACDYNVTVSTQGLAVNWPGSSPNVTAVGGTEFSADGGSAAKVTTYWNYSSTSDIISSALQYIPETAWNDTGGAFASGGGGVSTIFAMPSWQWAPSNFAGTNMRFVPDVAFSASADHDGYLTCTSGSCINGTFRSSSGYLTSYGGTSCGSPSFAGMVLLLAQKYGNLGNINPTLYGLAKTPAIYATAFNDITTGNNLQPCSTGTGCSNGHVGYEATTGYDLITGLGSVNGGALYTAMASAGIEVTSTTVSALPSSVIIGGTTVLTATVSSTSATPAGTVTFSIGSTTLGTATLSSGTATLSVAATTANGFSVGSDSITAAYGGNTTFASSNGSTSLTVANLTVSTATVAASPSSVALGGTTTLAVTVGPTTTKTPTGSVTFSIGTTTLGTVVLSGGTATLSNVTVSTADGFSVGSDTITASYSGNATFAASAGSTALTVTTDPTTITVSATPGSVMLGGATKLTASVSSSTAGAITGTVTFTIGATTLGTASVSNGTATLTSITASTSNGFSVGSDTITASYSGNASFAASAGSGTLIVATDPTSVTVSATPGSVTLDGATTLTASVSSSTVGAITGTMTFTIGSTTLGTASVSNGTGTLTSIAASAANGFSVGSDTITASYSGNATFAASAGSGTLTVTADPTTITVTATPSSITLGGTATLSAVLNSSTAGTIAGTVTFKVGNATIGTAPVLSGTATLINIGVTAADGFSVGSDSVTASYGGNSTFAASTGSGTLAVAAASAVPTEITVSATPSSVTLGGATMLTASVSSSTAGAITGTVTFTMGGTTLGTASVSGGTATLSNVAATAANGFTIGSDTISAFYSGNATFASSSGNGSLTVAAAPAPIATSYTLVASSTTLTASSSVTLTLTSTNYAGTVTLTPTVTSTDATASNVTASLAPASVTLTSDGTGTSTLTVSANSSASKRAPAVPWKCGVVLFGTVLLGVPFTLRKKRALTVLLMALTVAAAGFMIACGGGSSSSSSPAATRIYTVTVTPSGSGTVTDAAPVSITLTMQ
jgi:hypothetical protein